MAASLGIALTLCAAFATAIQVICIRLGTTKGRSNDALVVVLACNIAILVPLAAIRQYPNYGLTGRSLLAFAAAGLIGTMLGRAFYYAGIKQVGASRAEPVKASMPLYATVVAVLVLGETLTMGHLAGILLIVGGVALVSRESARDAGPAVDGSLRALTLPILGAICYGIEPIFAKFGFAAGTPVLTGLAIKTLTATVGFLGYLRWRDALPAWTAIMNRNARWFVGAGLANTGFLLAYYAALEITPVVLVVPIMQMSPLLVLALSATFLGHLERVTWRLAAAAVVIVVGATVVTITG